MRRYVIAVLVCVGLAFSASAFAQTVPGGGDKWVIMTYVEADGCNTPVPLPATKIKAGGVSFDLGPTPCSPDRAMLITDKQFPAGKLTGRSLVARIAITAPVGTTFSYWDNDLGEWGAAAPGGFVRLYIAGVNPALVGCEPGWHPERPDCEAQYWWSNPLHIDLADLAALGTKGITLGALLDPANWSDRDGHTGIFDADHTLWFNAAVKNATKMGLSFGGGGSWAFGVGADPSAKFLLYDFTIK